MIPLAALTATRTEANPWLASVYGGVFTAILAAIFTFVFPNTPAVYIIVYLLGGAGPVLGYQMATGQLVDWKSLIGSIIGPIIPILGWPILVGALTSSQSIGKLILGALIGTVLGLAVVLLLASPMGQDPSWLSFAYVIGSSIWGGSCAALMTAWGKR